MTQAETLKALKYDKWMTARELAKILPTSPNSIRRTLKRLKDLGEIRCKRETPCHGTVYVYKKVKQ